MSFKNLLMNGGLEKREKKKNARILSFDSIDVFEDNFSISDTRENTFINLFNSRLSNPSPSLSSVYIYNTYIY